MSIYKQASQRQLRFQTTVGSLSAEQLWNLSQTQLTNLIKSVKKTLKAEVDGDLSFLTTESTSSADVENQLRFDKEEADKAKLEATRKENNQKIMAIIQKKKEGEMEGKTIAELEAMLDA
jgi:hypothetical protein